MPHRAQAQQEPSVFDGFPGDGHPDGHCRSNGNTPTNGQPGASDTAVHLVDVAALLAENDGLRQRLASQPVIEQAKGILMGYYGISSDTAFQLLCRWSQDTNTKVRRIAELLADTVANSAGNRPAPPHEIVQASPSPENTSR